MSTKANVTKSDVQSKQHMSVDATNSKHNMSATGLETKIKIIPDVCAIKTAIEKKKDVSAKVWDVSAVMGCNFLQVKPNKEEYQVLKDDTFMLEFDGSTTMRKAFLKADGFVRYTLKLVDLDGIKPIENKYLIVGSQLELRLREAMGMCWLKKKQVGALPIILTLASPKIYNNKVYLSCTSSVMILEDDEIPVIKALKNANKYMLELDVSDDTAQVVVIMFNDIATALVRCFVGSLLDIEDEINLAKGGEDSVVSSTLDTVADIQAPKLKRLVRDPSVAIPSKPLEAKKKRKDIKDFDTKASDDSAKGVRKKKADQPFDKKKRNRVEIEDSNEDISYASDKEGNKDKKKKRNDMHIRRHPQSRQPQVGKLDAADVAQHTDGRLYGYCGLRLVYIVASGSAIKPPKRAALTSAGPPSYQCSMCDATIWYAERTDKARRVVHPTFSLCCQDAVEEERLKWTQNNQDTLCVDMYHTLCDVVTRADTSAACLGKRIVLPKSFIGSPRHMMQNYQDAMALCRV
ncbi:putative reverse transcriptase domain-containing protein [Tanacetum coccineum]